jgi:hypothetical protein
MLEPDSVFHIEVLLDSDSVTCPFIGNQVSSALPCEVIESNRGMVLSSPLSVGGAKACSPIEAADGVSERWRAKNVDELRGRAAKVVAEFIQKGSTVPH